MRRALRGFMSRPKLPTLKTRIPLQHQAAGGWRSTERGSSADRGYGYAWRKLREQILARDGGLCVPCRSIGLVSLARAVDHIVNKARGGGDNPSNLQAICNTCHDQKTQAEARGQDWAGPTRKNP